MKEVLAGTVEILKLRHVFYGTPSSRVEFVQDARYGALGRATVHVELSGPLRDPGKLHNLLENLDTVDAYIDGVPFELWYVSASHGRMSMDPFSLDALVTLQFEGVRVQPTLHPVVVWRNSRRES